MGPTVGDFLDNYWWFVRKSAIFDQLRLVVEIPLFTRFSTIQTVVGNEISEPSTVPTKDKMNLQNALTNSLKAFGNYFFKGCSTVPGLP